MSDHPPLFEGLKVIDCASFIAGPAAATIMADFGADVIKIEPPEGDLYRNYYQMPGAPVSLHNYPWDLCNRNKRSLVLDLKEPLGQAVLARLVAQADVFITNLPLPVRQRLNIGHEAMQQLNPRLIYASLTAYGETGPEADKPGFDATAYWARSGLQDLIRPDHTAPPARAVAGLGDHPTAVALYAAIATALYRRERTGRGGQVSTSLLANGIWANGVQVQAQLSGATIPPRPPRTQAPNPFGNVYRCRDDRWLNLVILNEAKLVPALLAAMDLSPLLADDRFATQAARRIHATALIALFDAAFATRDLADWRIRLDAAGITFGVIGTLADVPGDVQMRAAGVVVPFEGAAGLTVANPIQIEGVAQPVYRAAPGLGEHGAEVLRDAGFGDDEVAALLSRI
jgi:crotonobetainyl-CoA:carnitine CoA-transferase CaiB-like acyl-CoA transferase